jgi:oxazoline/thiazoline synthase
MNISMSSHEFSRGFSGVASYSTTTQLGTDLVIEQLDEFATGMYMFTCTIADYTLGNAPLAVQNLGLAMDPADLMLVSFKEHLRVETIPTEAVFLVSERGVTALSGSSILQLAPRLDGTRTVQQIAEELSAEFSPAQVRELLGQLSEAGLISYHRPGADGPGDAAARAYWSMAGLDAGDAVATVAALPVQLIVTGSHDRVAIVAACRAAGLTVTEPGSSAEFSLVLCDDYLDQSLAGVNADHLASRRPWLLAKPSGTSVWIGPVFLPGSGPCWACLAKRVKGNRPAGFLTQSGVPAAPSVPVSRAAALHVALLEVVQWLAGLRHEGQRELHIFDTLAMRHERHAIACRPQCASCGDPGLVAARMSMPVAIAGSDGAHRLHSPQQVIKRYGHLIDPVTGIVGGLRRNRECPESLYAYVAGSNRAMAQSSLPALRAGLRSHSGGKGATPAEAKAGALCEAVERYSATRDGDEFIIKDSYHGLGGQAVHPDACQLVHDRQFADRARWNATCAPFHRVPEPFDEREVIDWTPLWSLLSGGRRFLPTALLFFNPDPGRVPVSVRADSNGNAAGSSVEDAILRGFLELVERDAVALWWYNRTSQPAVSLDSFDDPWIARQPDVYRRLDRGVWVLDVTSDLGIPVMAAVSRRVDKPAEDVLLGLGAHFDPRIALRSALAELGQIMPTILRRDVGLGDPASDPDMRAWCRKVTVNSHRYLRPDPAQVPRTLASYGYCPELDLGIGRMCAAVRAAGLDLLVLDQTRPDIGMPVVKVVVPGLRHFWPRFAPGRLYDVPVRLGRSARPTAYADLNPVPLNL